MARTEQPFVQPAPSIISDNAALYKAMAEQLQAVASGEEVHAEIGQVSRELFLKLQAKESCWDGLLCVLG